MDFLTPNKSSPVQQQEQKGSKSDPSSKRSSNISEQLPQFVNVLAGGFRMRYPTCFVLIAEDQLTSMTVQHAQDLADRRPSSSHRNKHTGFPHPKLPLKRLPSSKRRCYISFRSLQRALRAERSFMPDFDSLHIKSRLLSQVAGDDSALNVNCEPKKSVSVISFVLTFKEETSIPGCLIIFSSQLAVPMHRRLGSVSQILRNFIAELDSSLGGGVNSGCNNNDLTTTGLKRQVSSTDPLMPKLSPQPSNLAGVAVGGGSSGISAATGDSLPNTTNPSVMTSNSQSGHQKLTTTKPPCLVNYLQPNSKEGGGGLTHTKAKPMDWDDIHAPVTPKVSALIHSS